MEIEPVADLYFGLMEKRSPTKGKLARRAYRNPRVNELYWSYRDRKVREPKRVDWRARWLERQTTAPATVRLERTGKPSESTAAAKTSHTG